MRNERSHRRPGARRLQTILSSLEAWCTAIIIGAVRLWR